MKANFETLFTIRKDKAGKPLFTKHGVPRLLGDVAKPKPSSGVDTAKPVNPKNRVVYTYRSDHKDHFFWE